MLTSTKKFGWSSKPTQTGVRANRQSFSKRLRKVLGFVVVLSAGAFVQMAVSAEEFWAIPLVKGKGDDYLFVVKPDAPESKSIRRLRCVESLPLFIEEMASSATRVDGKLLLRIDGRIVADSSEERVENVKIKLVSLTPQASFPAILSIKNWEMYPDYLPEEDSVVRK